MHKALWFLSGIVVAGAALAAWIFLLSPHGRDHGDQARMHEPITRAAALERQAERFVGFDVNGDGAVTLEEWEAFHAGRFDAVDADKDGTITRDEMRAAKKAKKPGVDDAS